jgi:hypothetical protein
MAKPRQGKKKSVPLTPRHDPETWRYASLQDALLSSTLLIAQLIQQGEAMYQAEIAAEATNDEAVQIGA